MADKVPKILVIEASVGSGHTRAAQAIAEALTIEDPSVSVTVLDILEKAGWFYRKVYRSFYVSLARHFPSFLDFFYDRSDSLPAWFWKVLLFFDRREFARFLSGFSGDLPDLAVCTHFLPLEILSDLKRRRSLTFPVWGVITDVHPHRIWIHDEIDRYFVPTSRGVDDIRARKGVRTMVREIGIPVHPAFCVPHNSEFLRKKWKLPGNFTVLLLAGGQGVGSLVPALDSFRGIDGEITLVAVAGKNRTLFNQCQTWAREHQRAGLTVRVLGFVRNLHEWMALSDLVVTKPGGLSVFESMALGKPLLLLPPRGGQERKNMEMAIEAGAGVRLRTPRETGEAVRNLLKNPRTFKNMSEASRMLGKPHAAGILARMILEELCTSRKSQ